MVGRLGPFTGRLTAGRPYPFSPMGKAGLDQVDSFDDDDAEAVRSALAKLRTAAGCGGKGHATKCC